MNETPQDKAQREAKYDLKKSEERLLKEAHEELLNPHRTPIENLVHAQKRLTSLTVKSSKTIAKLTHALTILTVVLVVATVILVCLAWNTDKNIHLIHDIAVQHQKTNAPVG